MRKQTTLAASVVQASMIVPSRSYRTRRRRSPLSQLIVRSTTHRTFLLPVIFYNLVQHLVAGAAARVIGDKDAVGHGDETAPFRVVSPREQLSTSRRIEQARALD